MKVPPGKAGQQLLRAGLCAIALAASSVPLRAQEPDPVPAAEAAPASAPSVTGPPVNVHGVVLNAATGQPLPRALVTVTSIQALGALTDGEGRFEIPGLPTGLQGFDVTKPGFDNEAAPSSDMENTVHTVRVANNMPELTFSLAPLNSIYGHVTLSTGIPAEGIGIKLLRRNISDGRGSWMVVGDHQTSPQGDFRFAGLSDGTYLLMTAPEFDNDRVGEPTCNADAPGEMAAYASAFYDDTQDLANATRIVLSGGKSGGINLALNLTRLHLVEFDLPQVPKAGDWQFSQTLVNHSGQVVPYPVHAEKDHSLCAYLPDGAYTLTVEGSEQEAERTLAPPGTRPAPRSQKLAGVLEFSVDGQSVRHLRAPLAAPISTPLHFQYKPGPPAPSDKTYDQQREGMEADGAPLNISGTSVNGVSPDGAASLEVKLANNDSYEIGSAAPGAYWITAAANASGTCVGSASAGGQNLARMPWIAGPSGAGPSIDVVIRTDCAKLTVALPPALMAGNSGEIPTYYVYAVPEFDSMEGPSQARLMQTENPTATMEDMTPGQYRVFVFHSPRQIEFRNPVALAQLGAGQQVTLAPGANANLVLQAPSE